MHVIEIDAGGSIRSPHLEFIETQREGKQHWGAYVVRKFDKVVPADGALLLKDKVDREWFEVSYVPKGVYLGFGGKFLEPDGTLVKTSSIWCVIENSRSLITLEQVPEEAVPHLYEVDPAMNPSVRYLAEEICRAREHLDRLERILAGMQLPR